MVKDINVFENTFEEDIPNIPNSPFTLKDGTQIENINSLIKTLEKMSSDDFTSYADRNKNEFAEWIETRFSEKKAAEKMRKTTDKNLTIWILKNDIENPESYDKTDEADEKNETGNESNAEIAENEKKNAPNKYSKYDSVLRYLKNNEISGFFKKKLLNNKNIPAEKTIEKNDETNNASEEIEVYTPKYIKTGITGFDELIQEGIPQGSCVLLCGGAGTGKTTFSLQILNNSAEKGEKCLYLTFEEEPAKLRSHMKNYGWDPVKLEKQGLLRIKKMQAFEISRCVEALLAKASGELIINIDELDGIIPNDFRPDKIVLDSLSAVSAAFIGKEEGYRIYIDQLFTMFKDIGATSFLISEVEENTSKYTKSGVEEFLADGVFVLYNLRQKNVRIQAIEIIKIRGTDFQKKIVPFKIIAKKGIVVFPKEDPFVE